MTIDELNALTTLTATDEVPVWDSEESGEPTKKITASNLAASVKSLASLPNTTEMNTAIQQSTATITGTVQSHASAGHGNMNSTNFKVSQSGNVVSLQGALTGLGAINVPDDTYNRQWIATISGVSMPPIAIRTTCTIANYAYEVGTTCYCAISTDGKITVTPPASVAAGKAVYMSIVYVV